MTDNTIISAPAGFFQADSIGPSTATDLTSAVNAAEANIQSAITAEAGALAAASSAVTAQVAAAGSANAAASSATTASTAASTASASASTATTQATNAAASASSVSGSVTTASNAASTATTQATAAASSATSASVSAGTATTAATNAGASATAAAASASTASTAATTASGASTAAINAGNGATTSATNANTSATNAAASATAAAGSATSASGSSSNANAQATNAATAAGAASTSATNAATSATAAQTASGLNVGRNLVHNPLFTIYQRAAAATADLAYSLDRWQAHLTLDTVSVSQVALADADRTAIGDETAVNALQNVFTGNAGATAFNVVQQPIEGVHRLSGKTVTVSWWAKATSGTPKMAVSLQQHFGTGGSPSASTAVAGGATAVLGTTWQQFSKQITLPSAAGKTFGTTAGTDLTELVFWFSSGTGNATEASSIGVQSGTVQIWGVQLEVASSATPLEKRDPGLDLSLCQRFYQVVSMFAAMFSTGVGQGMGTSASFLTAMRATPTLAISNNSSANLSGAAVVATGASGVSGSGSSTASGNVQVNLTVTCSADL